MVRAMSAICPTCGQPKPIDGGALGNLIRSRRTAMHLSLRDVERISGGKISNGYLSQIETGRIKDPSISMCLTISAVLSLHIDDMLCMIDPLYLPAR